MNNKLAMKEFFDLASLSKYLNERPDDSFYKPIIDLIGVYDGTIGGCSCNRNVRILNADNYFKAKILNLDKTFLEDFRKVLNVKEVIFKDFEGNIFYKLN
jgi:hypothetical protein